MRRRSFISLAFVSMTVLWSPRVFAQTWTLWANSSNGLKSVTFPRLALNSQSRDIYFSYLVPQTDANGMVYRAKLDDPVPAFKPMPQFKLPTPGAGKTYNNVFTMMTGISESCASVKGDIWISRIDENQIDERSEMQLPLSSEVSTNSMRELMDAAFLSAEMIESFPGTHVIAPGEFDSAVVDWLANEMHMSIDPTDSPQGVTPDFACVDPPFGCPANVKCPLSGGANAICVVTSCGMGECSACPVKTQVSL